jgi:hypothetical protein
MSQPTKKRRLIIPEEDEIEAEHDDLDRNISFVFANFRNGENSNNQKELTSRSEKVGIDVKSLSNVL